jgi:hypothetical protein
MKCLRLLTSLALVAMLARPLNGECLSAKQILGEVQRSFPTAETDSAFVRRIAQKLQARAAIALQGNVAEQFQALEAAVQPVGGSPTWGTLALRQKSGALQIGAALQRAQDLANSGELVLIVRQGAAAPDAGNIAIVLPGQLSDDAEWNDVKTPAVANKAAPMASEFQSLGAVFKKAQRPGVEIFYYLP